MCIACFVLYVSFNRTPIDILSELISICVVRIKNQTNNITTILKLNCVLFLNHMSMASSFTTFSFIFVCLLSLHARTVSIRNAMSREMIYSKRL